METTFVHPPLSNIQVELLKLFNTNIPEIRLHELKKVIAGFLLEHARDKADAIWEERNYSDEKLMKLLDKPQCND